MQESFDAVIVGTGFASTFFLVEHLKHARPNARILVLDRGKKYDHAWRVRKRKSSSVPFDPQFINRTPSKIWIQNIAFGGGTCWTGNTPRMHPHDFETRTRFGVGVDWPFGYDELEPYFLAVERLMGISGSEEGPFPRSAPYPAPPHKLSGFDRAVAERFPGEMVPMPSARSSSGTTGRPTCCANSICATCPIAAKFQVDQHLLAPYEDPRVELRLEAQVVGLDVSGDRVTGVHYKKDGREHRVGCELAVLGTHAIFNPYLMLASGITGPALGRYLNEQWGVGVKIDLDGLDSLDGSQMVSGLGTMFLDGEFRRQRPGCLIESWNSPWLRAERGRWRQRAFIRLVFEDIPSADSRVEVAKEDASKPAVTYAARTPYELAGRAVAEQLVETLLSDLPVEAYEVDAAPEAFRGSEAHIQGTTRMGKDPETSVLDPDLVHHRVRNLVVVGSSVFPTCMAANPTLPLSALAMRAARRLSAGAVP